MGFGVVLCRYVDAKWLTAVLPPPSHYAARFSPSMSPDPRSRRSKLCASVYPDFQASVCYEHLCSELTMGPRSPARLPPGPPDDADFDPPPHQDAAAAAAASGGGGGVPSSTSLAAMHAVRGTRGLSASSESTQSTTAGAGTVPSSPPRRAQAPPPLRQKMLQQQQQQMLHQQQQGGPGVRHGSGGGSGVGERSREKPRSPFAFLGGGSPPRDSPRERDRERVAWDGTRRSSAPGVSAGGTASRGPGTGVAASGRGGGLGSGGGGRVGGDSFGPEEDVPRPPAQGAARGGVGTVSGPQFDLLWRASRGWVLEKVMRRVELPPHVSRHRPPWDRVGQEQGQGHGGEGGEAGRGRKSSRRGTGPAVSPGEMCCVPSVRRSGCVLVCTTQFDFVLCAFGHISMLRMRLGGEAKC